MRQLRGQFFRAWSEVQKRVEEATGGGKLPDEMARDWEARWAEQIFLGSIAQHPYLTPAEAACVVSQIRATFDAAWVVRGIEGAPSVWFHQSEHSRGPNDPAERVISWCWRNNRITDGERLRRSVETHNGGELSADVVLDQLNVWTRGVGSVHPARKTKLPTPNETPAWLRGLCFSLDPSWRAHFPVATACEKIRGPIQPSVTAVSEVLCIEGELLDSPGLDLTALRARLQRWLWRAEEAVRRQSNGQTGGTLTANAVESLRPDQLRFPDESVGQFGLKQILILRALMAAPNRALDRDSLARAAGYRQTEKGYHALQQRALAANGSFEKQDLLWLVETGEVYRLISTLKDNS